MKPIIVTANSIQSDTIQAAIQELSLRDDTKHLGFDLQEAIATHIVITDTDYNSDELKGLAMTTVKFENQTYTLTQEAYINFDPATGLITYRASATNEAGQVCELVWSPLEDDSVVEDDIACDWANPSSVVKEA
jgi:hypothetical protein